MRARRVYILLIFRQHIAMRCDEFIHKRPDLIEAEFSSRVRIEHRGMIDVFTFAREGGLDNERLHIDIRLLKRGELWRHHTNFCGLQSALIHEAGDFNTTTLRQVINESAIGDVAIDNARCAGFHGMNNERTIFLTALIPLFIEFTTFKRGFIRFPLRDLIFTTPDIFIDGNLVLLEKIRLATFDEPWHVFAEVLARLGYEISRAT